MSPENIFWCGMGYILGCLTEIVIYNLIKKKD